MLEPDGESLVFDHLSIQSRARSLAEKAVGFNLHEHRTSLGIWPIGEVVEQSKPIFVADPVAVAEAILPQVPQKVLRLAIQAAGVTREVKSIFVPLSVEQRVLGILAVWGKDVRQEDVAPLSVFAGQVAVALENAHLYASERQRAEDLARTTEQLSDELAERMRAEEQIRKNEVRLQGLLRMSQYKAESIQDLLDQTLNEAILLTESKIGYIYLYDERKKEFTLNTWSRDVMRQCTVADPQTLYGLDTTGIWGEAVRQRKPIVVNDFQAPHPLKRGYPEGHAHLSSFMTVPVFKDDVIVAVVGAANKAGDYSEADVVQLTLLMDAVWRIVERMHAEKALKDSEVRYRRLFESAKDGILILDAETGQISDVNPFLLEMLGYSHEELLGKELWEIGLFKDIVDSRDAFAELQKERYIRYENLPLETKEGRHADVEFVSNVYRVDSRKVIQCNIRDITERARAQKLREVMYRIADAANRTEDLAELSESIQKHLGEVIDTTNFYVALYDPATDMLSLPYFTDQKDTIDSFPAGKSLTAYVIRTSEPLLATQEVLNRLEESGEAKIVGSPARIWLGAPLRVGKNVIGAVAVQSYTDPGCYTAEDLEILSFVSDQIAITVQRKHAEEALRESEERFRATFEQVAVGVSHLSLDGCYQRVNQKLCDILGYTEVELLAMEFQDITYAEDLPANLMYRSQLLAGEVPTFSMEKRYLRKNGSLIWANVTVALVKTPTGEPDYFISIVEDITERKRLEAQLVQSQKMETVGRLAGGVAHDFNNLLTAISGYANFALEALPVGDPVRDDVVQIIKAGDRAAGLTRQLLAFSRRQIIEMRTINLNDLILDLDKMLRRLIGEDIELVTLPTSGLGKVKADPGQIEQVLVNLVVNARDAMPGGGTLTLETANVTMDEEYALRYPGARPGEYVMLTVSDTGTGMSEEVKSHLFEPFFTTKDPGKGTGLGLATVYGIVKQHNGNIYVDSEPGGGSSFRVYLPLVEVDSERLPRRDAEGYLPLGSETVLTVEDEASVRSITARVLTELGYRVLEAANGEDALRVAQKHDGPIHLLVTDVVMPQMGGGELAGRMATMRPEVKVLFVSGYTDEAIVRAGILNRRAAFLQKPFTTAALARKVRETLDRT
jgi:two-component system cell cycle sensor histidine kinase/response regulator CckA